MRPWIVAMTGASGAAYGVRLVRHLLDGNIGVALVLSEPARLVIAEELGITLKSLNKKDSYLELFAGSSLDKLEIYSPRDFTAPIASGSYPVEGMVVIPCSMGTLGSIAAGVSQNLIHRAADCILKESSQLILVPRETPLNAIHLENMLKLSRAGAKIVPAMPGFYSGASTLDDVIDFMTGKVLDQMKVPHALYPRWTGSFKKQVSE